MALQYKVFALSAKGGSEIELNQFLNTVNVITVHREFINNGDNSFFSIIVEYMKNSSSIPAFKSESKKRIDYREVLSPEDFALYAKIRDWRKETAQKQAVQLYTIMTNEQMATIAKNRITTKDGLSKIDKFGDARMNNYGDDLIAIVKNEITIQE
ncbi:HRDC domain-containing protein [Candidatus Magnetomorum sp. HK-1]|nr:HRDC domain-containing protein [Candidatus Magnetomorum sp. HK-1]